MSIWVEVLLYIVTFLAGGFVYSAISFQVVKRSPEVQNMISDMLDDMAWQREQQEKAGK